MGRTLLAAVSLVLATCVAAGEAQTPGPVNSGEGPSASARESCLGLASDEAAIFEALATVRTAGASEDRVFWLYAKYGFLPIWHRNDRLTEAGWRLRGQLTHAASHGLDPRAYDPSSFWPTVLVPRPGESPAQSMARMDLRLTRAFLQFADDMIEGPALLGEGIKGWHLEGRKRDPVQLLDEAVLTGDPDAAVARLIPRHPQYARLQAALERYRQLAAQGNWQPLPPGPILRKGDRGDALRVLTARLLRTGEIDKAAAKAAGTFFDGQVEAAVKRFQVRHGLQPDGLVGDDTRKALNAPVGELVKRIELQLARWRELPEDLGPRYLLVNIPEFRLRLFEGDRVALAMKVIVGQDDWPTPVFRDKIKYVVFNPYWTVPHTIAVKELLPLLKKDPDYLEQKNMEVLVDNRVVDPSGIDWDAYTTRTFPYELRQRPGADNALGLVKFFLPNPYAVYLHDTPTVRLFAQAKRNLSHGCIRLERAADLVHSLLGQNSPEGDGPLVPGSKPRWVRMGKPLPVYIVYLTVYVEDDGEVGFFDDLYGYDARMYARLGLPPGPGLRSAGGRSDTVETL